MFIQVPLVDQFNCVENAEIKCINRQIFDCSVLTFLEAEGKKQSFQ